jgi:hypothetical protein
VRGWNLVVKKDEVAVGDKVVYFKIDSHLPLSDPRFAFLAPRGSKIVNGVDGVPATVLFVGSSLSISSTAP